MYKRDILLYINDIYSSCDSMRNKVTHEYFGGDEEILWATIKDNIPKLKTDFSKMKSSFKKQPLF